MLRVAVHVHLKAARAGDGAHNAHGIAVLFQDFSLLNVQFQVFANAFDAVGRQAVALALEHFVQRFALLVHGLAHVVLVDFLGDKATADGASAEVAGLLAAHGAHANGQVKAIAFGPAHHQQPRDDARHAVVAPAFDHRIQVRADQPVRLVLAVLRTVQVGVAHLVGEVAVAFFLAKFAQRAVHLVLDFGIAKPGDAAGFATADAVEPVEKIFRVFNVFNSVPHSCPFRISAW